MSASEEQLTRLFKSRRTVIEMLRDRGYSVPESDIYMTRQQFIEKYGDNIHHKRDDLLMLCNKGEAPTDKIYVFFPKGEKIGVPIIRDCITRMKADNVYNAIIVLQIPLKGPAMKLIGEFNSRFHLEVFQEAELLTNITQHMFVPKHTVLKDDEKKKLLEKYRVKDTQLPRILVSDPVARYYGMKRGQVVRITRQSVTADTYDTYRYAV